MINQRCDKTEQNNFHNSGKSNLSYNGLKELTSCENMVLNLLIEKNINGLTPYLAKEFEFIIPYGEIISKENLVKQLRQKQGFWYSLLFSAKKPADFSISENPDLTLPEFSVSDMLKRGNISVDFSNPEANYRDVITKYNDYKKSEVGYEYRLKFNTVDNENCVFYAVGF
ncbi:MAG: hypothetical protein O9264_10245 [Leptospira sp.]|nr:hypothetical protein [Leptospira sp.]